MDDVNGRPNYLNFTLGAIVYDSYSDPDTAVRASLEMISVSVEIVHTYLSICWFPLVNKMRFFEREYATIVGQLGTFIVRMSTCQESGNQTCGGERLQCTRVNNRCRMMNDVYYSCLFDYLANVTLKAQTLGHRVDLVFGKHPN